MKKPKSGAELERTLNVSVMSFKKSSPAKVYQAWTHGVIFNNTLAHFVLHFKNI